MKIIDARAPVATPSGQIELLVQFEEFDEELPFSASPDDVEPYGRELYQRAIAGEFGPVAPYVAPVASPEQIQALIVTATQARLDVFAKTRNYDGILSACTYATSGVPAFASEGQYCVQARDVTWGTLYTIMGEVQAGTRPMPTGFSDIEPLLPALVWPL